MSQHELENCLVQPNSGILGVSSPNKKFYTILAGLEPTIKEKHIRTQHCSQVGAEVTPKPSPVHQMVLWFQVVRGGGRGHRGMAPALGLAEAREASGRPPEGLTWEKRGESGPCGQGALGSDLKSLKKGAMW